MSGDEVTALLRSHLPADRKEAADLVTMRRAASELAEPCSRDQAGAHFTASAAVVDPAGERVALVHHRKLGRWLQPGGHVEPGDASFEAAACREAREELGVEAALHPTAPRPLDVDVHELPASAAGDAHLHLDVRFLLVAASDVLAGDAVESHAVEWRSFDDALALADEEPLRRLLRKTQAVVRPRREDVTRA